MKLKTTLNGQTFAFRDIRDVLAKANEPKSADRFQGIAAETASERVAAKVVLSELTVEDLTENPTIPYEEDEVTRVNIDGLNRPMYERFKGMTIGELREWILDHKTSREELCRASRAFTGEVVAAVAKIMSAMDLVYGASKIVRPTKCITEIGLPGTLSFRCQTNSPTDDVPSILMGVMEGVSYGSGDACIGINPVGDNVENTMRMAQGMWDFVVKNDIPTQVTILSHITTQMEAVRRGAPLSMFFQSIAGSQKGNEAFGFTAETIAEARELALREGTATGPNVMYFETGQGSELSSEAHHGADQVVMEIGRASCRERV